MRILSLFSVPLLALAALSACSRAGVEDIPETLGNLANLEGQVVGTTLDGAEIKLNEGDLAGKAVILNYFSSG